MSYVIADINDCFQKSGRSFFPDEVPGSIQLKITIKTVSAEESTILNPGTTYTIQTQPVTEILGGQEFQMCRFQGKTNAGILYQPIRLSSTIPVFVIKNNTLIEASTGTLEAVVVSGTPQAASLETAVEGFGCTLKEPSSEYESSRLIRQEDLVQPATQSDSYVTLCYNKNYIKVTRVSESTAIPYLPYDDDEREYEIKDEQLTYEFGNIPLYSIEDSSKTYIKCAVGETVLIETIRSARNTRLWGIAGYEDVNEDFVYLATLYQDEDGYERDHIDQCAISYYYTVQSDIYDEYREQTYTVPTQYIYFFNPTYKVSVISRSDLSNIPITTSVSFSSDNIDWHSYVNFFSPTVGTKVWIKFELYVNDPTIYTVSDFVATAVNDKTGEQIESISGNARKMEFVMPASDVPVVWNIRVNEAEQKPHCLITVKEDINYLGRCLDEIKVIGNVNSQVFTQYHFPAPVDQEQTVKIEWTANSSKRLKYAIIKDSAYTEMLQYDKSNQCSYEVKIGKDVKEKTIIISSYCDAIILDLTTIPHTNVSGREVKKLIDQHPTLWGMSSEGYVKAPEVFSDGLFRRLYLLPSEPITRTPSCLDSRLNVVNPLSGGAFRNVHKKGIPDSCTCYLPNTITTIEDNSFRASHLQFVIPESVTYIGHGAFHGNILTSFMKLPDNSNIKFLSHNTFEACYKLKGVAGGNSLQYISQWAGYSAQLDYVFIPENAIEVGCESFIQTGDSKEQLYPDISNAIYAHSNPKVIVWNAANCTKTGTDIFPSEPKIIIFGPNVQQVPDSQIFCKAKTWVFQGSTPPTFLKNSSPIKVENLYYPSSAASSYSNFYPDITNRQGFSNLEDLFIFNLKYTTSDNKAVWPYRLDKCDQVPLFNTYTNGTGKLQYVLPITNIGDWQFAGLTQLTSITLPNTITSIGANAFSRCGLKSLSIPSDVTYISNKAFTETEITSLTWNVPNYTGVPEISDSPFGPLQSTVTSLVFGSSVNTVPDIFNYFKNVKSISLPNNITSLSTRFAGWKSLQSVTWNIVDHEDFRQYYGPFTHNHSTITKFIFGSSVKRIPANLCERLDKITSIVIPDNVTSIGDDAFYQCTGLTSVTIGNGVTNIGQSAFWECTGLTSVTIPNGVTSIGNMAFIDCTGLTSVTIPNSVTSIGSSAFNGCKNLASITIPSSVTWIGPSTFRGCTFKKSKFINHSSLDAEANGYWGATIIP